MRERNSHDDVCNVDYRQKNMEVNFKDFEDKLASLEVHLIAKKEPFLIDVHEDTLTSAEDPTLFYRVPYGMALWEASVALAYSISSNLVRSLSRVNASTTVLELGSGGVPLPTMVCAAAFGASCVFSDNQPECLILGERNVSKNKMVTESGIRGAHIDWCENDTIPDHSFDVVLGADVVYCEDLHPELVKTVQKVTHFGSLVCFCQKRRLSESVSSLFQDKFPNAGFKVVERVSHDSWERYKQMGRVSHDSDGTPIEIVVLEKVC